MVRTTKDLAMVMAALAVLVAVGASAFAKNTHTLNLRRDAMLSGTRLDAGEYKIQWDNQSPGVMVKFSKKGNIMATAQGKLVDRGTTYRTDCVVYDTSADGSNTIREIRLGGSSEAIVLIE